MASRLFNVAAQAVQRLASRGYGRSLIGRAATLIRRATSAKSNEISSALGGPVAQRLIAEVGRGARGENESVEKYSQRAASLLGSLLSSLGPLGEAIRLAVGGSPRRSLYGDQLESAIALVRALGGEYLTSDPNSPHYQRGLAAARSIIGKSGGGELNPAEVMKRLQDVQRAIEMSGEGGGGGKPPRGPTTGGGEWPEEHGISLVGRDSASYDREAMEAILAREIRTPDSSNVYSFVFEEETDPAKRFQERSGILYVTFRPWFPGMGKERPNGPGPMYAYYDVPWRRYKTFEAAAKYGSAGGAVWTFLRIRGSKWDHRFPYRLVSGTLIPAGGVYVPRKATRLGYRRRALPQMGVGRRGFVRSTLPEQIFRAPPNRGGPNRGKPNRGR